MLENKTYCGGKWTQARMNSFIKSALRSASQRWPPRYDAVNNACTGQKINPKSGRLAKHYECNECHNDFPAKDVQVDHIHPIIDPAVGFQTWDILIANLFCEKENLQLLCKPCHQIKTNAEKAIKKAKKND
jgi:5-methylcytosine-specific restriction endonuclease McrA